MALNNVQDDTCWRRGLSILFLDKSVQVVRLGCTQVQIDIDCADLDFISLTIGIDHLDESLLRLRELIQ